MPLPRWLGRFNVRVTNRILGPIVMYVPGYGRVVHVGRRTGRIHRTPVMLFRRGDQGVFALTYGPGTEWVQNVLAEGACRFESARTSIDLEGPELVHDPSRPFVPRPMRPVLRVLGASDFLVMTVVEEVPRG